MKRSTFLTPEVVEAMAKEAEAIHEAMNAVKDTSTEVPKTNNIASPIAEAPSLVKFKFVLCEVDINNINAVVQGTSGQA